MPVPASNRPSDQPIYWFATLEAALDNGDLEAAALAVQELRRLGIHVRVPHWGAAPTESETLAADTTGVGCARNGPRGVCPPTAKGGVRG